MASIGRITLFIVSVNFVYGTRTLLTGSNEVAFKDQSFSLNCAVTSGGLTAVAFLRNDNIFASIANENGNCRHRETGLLCVPDICSCNGTHSFNWTVTNIPESWHNSTLICDSIYGGVRSNVYSLYVVVPVTEARILPNVSSIDLIGGNLFSFICYSQPASRPQAILKWYMDDVNGRRDEITEGITDQTFFSGINGVYVSNSTLLYSPTSYNNGHTIFCTASTIYTVAEISTRVSLNILFKPNSTLSISTVPEGPMFPINSTVQLKCALDGGNPLANLSWSCDTLNTSEITTDVSANRSAALVLTLFIASWDVDGKKCTCEGTHFIDNFNQSQSVVLWLYPTTTAMHTPQITTSAYTSTVKSTTTDIIENNNDKLNEDDNTTLIVGTVAGIAVVVSALIGFGIFVFRKRNASAQNRLPETIIHDASVQTTIGARHRNEITETLDSFTEGSTGSILSRRRSYRELKNRKRANPERVYDTIDETAQPASIAPALTASGYIKMKPPSKKLDQPTTTETTSLQNISDTADETSKPASIATALPASEYVNIKPPSKNLDQPTTTETTSLHNIYDTADGISKPASIATALTARGYVIMKPPSKEVGPQTTTETTSL